MLLLKQKMFLGVSRVLLEWLPDAEKISSDGMMNKQTQTFNSPPPGLYGYLSIHFNLPLILVISLSQRD